MTHSKRLKPISRIRSQDQTGQLKSSMDKQLDDLRKWSEEMTRSVFDGFSQMFKGFQPPEPTAPDSTGGVLTRILQMNQLTLSALKQYRHLEKLNESMKQFNDGLMKGAGKSPDDRTQKLETEIGELKSRLNEQEKLLKDLQAKLQSEEENISADPSTATQILSDFFSEQNKQFKKFVGPKD